MGAWGKNNFENDMAFDFMYDLENAKNKQIIVAAFQSVINNAGYIDVDDCTMALAAAEMVYAGISNDYDCVPDQVKTWINKKNGVAFTQSDASLAIQAIIKITDSDSSELKGLWEDSKESEAFNEWNTIQNNLVNKLKRVAG